MKFSSYCLLIIVILLQMSLFSLSSSSKPQIVSSPPKIIAFVPDKFFYHDLFDVSWDYYGCNVTIAGLESVVTGGNYPHQVDMPLLISDIEDITQFDCIFIPGGFSNELLAYNDTVISLIQTAYEAGLIFATLGSGSLVLAEAGIISGKNITGTEAIIPELESAGGIYQPEEVVVDLPIISSTTRAEGSVIAAYYEFSIAVARALDFYEENPPVVIEGKVIPDQDMIHITAKISDETKIVYCGAKLSLLNGSSEILVLVLSLKDPDNDGNFEGKSSTLLQLGTYVLDLIVEDSFRNSINVENVTTFQYPFSLTSQPPTSDADIDFIVPLFACLVIGIVNILFKKKRKRKLI